jgi:hypothetical protein
MPLLPLSVGTLAVLWRRRGELRLLQNVEERLLTKGTFDSSWTLCSQQSVTLTGQRICRCD